MSIYYIYGTIDALTSSITENNGTRISTSTYYPIDESSALPCEMENIILSGSLMQEPD